MKLKMQNTPTTTYFLRAQRMKTSCIVHDVTFGNCRIKGFNITSVIIKLSLQSFTQSSLSNYKSITCCLNVPHGNCSESCMPLTHSSRLCSTNTVQGYKQVHQFGSLTRNSPLGDNKMYMPLDQLQYTVMK